MLHQTRIQHLAKKAPDRVIEEDGQLYAVPYPSEIVNDMMVAVDVLTADWAEANGLDPHAKACQPYLGMLRRCVDAFWSHELGWG